MDMCKIKNKLIELLGGVTVEEHKKWLEWKYISGKAFAYETVRTEMISVYKKTIDEQYNTIYDFVTESILDCYEHLREMKTHK